MNKPLIHEIGLPEFASYPHGNPGFRILDARNQYGCHNDYEAIKLWLDQQHSERTREAYWREVKRLMYWAVEYPQKPICALDLKDYMDYKEFLANPAEHWTGARRVEAGQTPNLLVGPLTKKSIQYAITCVASLLTFWSNIGYIYRSPLAGMKRIKAGKRPKKHSLSQQDLEYVYRAIVAMPKEKDFDTFNQARLKWAFKLFLRLGLRIDEAITHTMGSFHQVLSGSDHVWMFNVWGKGRDKDGEADVLPVTTDLLSALYEFRKVMGWQPAYPVTQSVESLRPLIPRDMNSNACFTAQNLRYQINKIFWQAADLLENERPDDPGVTRLRTATPHILRHTAITLVGNATMDVRIQQCFARHNDINTTMTYDHTEMDQIRDVMIRVEV